jgi:hypothetical protein
MSGRSSSHATTRIGPRRWSRRIRCATCSVSILELSTDHQFDAHVLANGILG